VATFLFSLVNVAALTRLLPIEEYGLLAVYLVLATLLTTVYNLGSLQGILSSVVGVADGDAESALDDIDAEALRDVDRERALTTGVLLTVVIAALGTLVVFAIAPLVADLLGVPGQLEAVRLAALCGATGAVWRLVQNVTRLERRPGAYSALGVLRPALALALGIAFVVAGHGVEGALAGIAAGTALAVPVAIAVGHRSYAFGLELSIIPHVFRRGAFVVPVILAMWIVGNADVYLVSLFAPADSVGPYRVAARLGMGVSYLVSAVTMAWLPLTRTPLHSAMTERHGPSGFGATVLTVFLLLCIWVVLGLTLLADLLMKVAPASYSGAAPLVPLVALGVVAFGVLMVLYRGTSFPNRRRRFIFVMLAAALAFVAAALALVPPYGGYGAAIAQIIAFTVAAAVMLWFAQRSEHPLPIQWGRLGRGVALGLLCIGLSQLFSPLGGAWLLAVHMLILVAFPVLLILTRAFPREELHAFIDLSWPGDPRQPDDLVAKLEELEPRDRRLVATLVPKGGSAADAARAMGTDDREEMSRFVASLRALGPNGNGHSSVHDEEIATYLLESRGVARRDLLAEQLCEEEDIDPLDLDALDMTLTRLRRLPRRTWERLGS
jgi:O-antigen/teichoic acid export membrane protein